MNRLAASRKAVPPLRNRAGAFPEIEKHMLYRLGRFLQVIGLIVPLAGVSGNVARPDDINLRVSLTMAVVGIGVFYLGRVLQQNAAPPA